MQDIHLGELLASLGLEGPRNTEVGLAALHAHGLTRPGKQRISIAKQDAAVKALRAALIRTCHKPACKATAQHDGRTIVNVGIVSHCDICNGKDNQRAVAAMLDAMHQTGQTKLLVAGGAPDSRKALANLCGSSCKVRFISSDDHPSRKKTADPGMAWADIVVIWASTEIPHKTTVTLRGPKVITVPRRGIASLADEVTRFIAGEG